MDYKDIQKLIQTVSDSELQEVEIELEGLRLVMKKAIDQVVVHPTQIQSPQMEQREIAHTTVQKVTSQEEGKVVNSPIVGTFYASPHPDSPPFVSVGEKVKKGQMLCIIEAMKLMNEIESDMDGEVVEVLADNEDLVQYGQPLFRIV